MNKPTTCTGLANPYSKTKKAPATLKSIEISRSADGGFIMRHNTDSYEHEPATNTAKTGAEMIAHISKHMGITTEGAKDKD